MNEEIKKELKEDLEKLKKEVQELKETKDRHIESILHIPDGVEGHELVIAPKNGIVGSIKFKTADKAHFTEIKSPTGLSGDISMFLPVSQGSENQLLGLDGSGNLSWLDGAIGATGPAGIQGATGIGAVGSTGVEGVMGATGLSGSDGATGVGGSSVLGLPTDTVYGGSGGNISGVAEGDRVEDAFDKVEVILGKLAPTKPANLSTKTISISGTYSALESGTGTSRSIVIDSTQPEADTPSGAANGFYDGDSGTLSAEVDSVTSGSRVLTTASDVGTYTSLKILTDYDFYAGVAGKEGFWKALTAGVQSSSTLSLGQHTYRLLHSTTGNTPVYTFYVDNPTTPTISSYSITGSGTGRYISGVPSLATGDTVQANFTVGSAIRQHYNSTRIAAASSSCTTSANAPLPGTPPNSGDNFVASINLTVQTNKYAELTSGVSVTCTGYNSKGTTATQSVTNSIRIDTVSDESSRKKSGTGQYPTKGSGSTQFGDSYVSTTSLSGLEELQLLNGLYQYPEIRDYSSNTPTAGPDYYNGGSGLSGGSYNNMRWVTLSLGSISSASAITVTFAGTVNFGSSTIVSGLAFYCLIDGSSPTGWLDGNAAYPGYGDPANDGDAALVFASSTATSKRITFGTTTRTGTVWVRIGFPTGSTKKFSSVSFS